MLGSILGDEGSSRLFWELIDTGRAEVATCWPQEFSDQGAWFTYLICDPQNLASNLQSIRTLSDQLVQAAPDEKELQQAINKNTASYIMHSERPGNRLFGLGSRYLMHGEYLDLDQTISGMRGVTTDAIARVAKKYLAATPSAVQAGN